MCNSTYDLLRGFKVGAFICFSIQFLSDSTLYAVRETKSSTPNFDMAYNYQNKYVTISIIRKKKSVALKNGVSLGAEHEGYDLLRHDVMYCAICRRKCLEGTFCLHL